MGLCPILRYAQTDFIFFFSLCSKIISFLSQSFAALQITLLTFYFLLDKEKALLSKTKR